MPDEQLEFDLHPTDEEQLLERMICFVGRGAPATYLDHARTARRQHNTGPTPLLRRIVKLVTCR